MKGVFPFCLHWKSWLLPAAVALVAVWILYFGAAAVIVAPHKDAAGADRRASQRAATPGAAPQAGAEKKNPEDTPGAVPDKTAATPKSDKHLPDRVKSYQAARRAVALAEVARPPRKPVVRHGSSRPPAAAHGTDTRRMLREQLLGEAYQVALHSRKPWLNLIAVSSEYYRRGDRRTAREVLLTAEKLAVNPNDASLTSSSVRHVVQAMLAQGNNDDAVDALQNIRRAADRERATAEVAVWAARGGRLKIAGSLAGQLPASVHRDNALAAIAESQASYEGLPKALQTAGMIGSVWKQNDAYRRIAMKRAAANDFSAAETAVGYIKDKNMRSATLGAVARQRARGGDLAGGLKTMLAVSDPKVVDASLRSLAEELAKTGRFSVSAYVTTRIRNNREKSYALERLSVELARAGDVVGSLVKTDAIPLDSVRERTLRNVSSVTAWRGEPGRARNVAFRIHSNRERDRAYRSIADATAKIGDYTAAFNTLQEIDFPHDKALALVSLARARQKDGNGRKALALLEGAGRTARELHSARDLDSVRANMAVAYAECAESERSLQLAAKIGNVSYRDRAYRNLAGALAVNRDVHSAQKSVMSIASEQMRRSAGDRVAHTLAQYTPPDQAVRSARRLPSARQRMVFLLEVSRKI